MKKILLKFLVIFGFALFGLLSMHHGAEAATFNPNNIIDDVVFENIGTMNASQIDTWLNSFPSSCISPNSGFRTPDPQGWSDAQNKYLYGGNVTAGTAIYHVAVLYHVNPQVILTTLQKEQSIPTGSAGCHYNTPDPATATNSPCGSARTPCTIACPYSGGCMNIALGYGCPNYCAAVDEGFSVQLTLGTWLLRFGQQRAYGRLTGYTGYETGDENFTYNGPMTPGVRKRSASSSAVYYDGSYTTVNGVSVSISNGSTASLYNFTPFTSGNQNFVNIFTNWFGSTYAIYSWQLVSQTVYTDSSRSSAYGWGATLTPGQSAYAVIIVANTGDVTWTNSGNNPVDLGTSQPADRSSPFCTGAWLGCSRPARLQEASVEPGQWGTFAFPITAPGALGLFNEHFNILAEGITWFNDPGQFLQLNIIPIHFSWQPVSQAIFSDSSMSTFYGWGSNLVPGQTAYATIIIANTSNFTWTQTGYTSVWLGTSGPNDRGSPFCTGAWSSCNRPGLLQQSSVPPGGWGSFAFPITAPGSTGLYHEHFNLVSSSWFNDPGQHFDLNVVPKQLSWQPVSQAVYTNSGMGTLIGWDASLSTGQSAYAIISVRNTGNFTWTNSGPNAIDLGTWASADRSSPFYNAWLRTTRPATLTQSSVPGGQTGTFQFPITAPGTPGTYNEYFNMVSEGLAWFNDPGQHFVFTVH